MKKIIAILLALVLALSVAACSTGGTTPEKEPEAADNQSETDSAPEDAETDIGEDEQEEEVPDDPGSDFDSSIQETVLVDEQGVKITATGFEEGSLFGPELKVIIENNSGKNLSFQTRNSAINNYMIDTMLLDDVPDGETVNSEITFSSVDLEAAGIREIADMEMSFFVYETESWEKYFESDIITIRTAGGENYEYTYDDSGDILFENDEVKIVSKGMAEKESVLGPGILIYIENKGENTVIVQTATTSVNDQMIEPMFSSEVGAGKRAIDTLTIRTAELEEKGISEIETVGLSFVIYNSGNWLDAAETDPITISF